MSEPTPRPNSASGNNSFAFPHSFQTKDGQTVVADGMSLRDYFAGQAVVGFCAGTIYTAALEKFPNDKVAGAIAVVAYDLADAMIEERER